MGYTTETLGLWGSQPTSVSFAAEMQSPRLHEASWSPSRVLFAVFYSYHSLSFHNSYPPPVTTDFIHWNYTLTDLSGICLVKCFG